MAKTTKIIRGIASWITFQKHQGIQSLTIKGKPELADLSQDKNGDTDLILNSDKDKINSISSAIPFITITESTEGTDPNQLKKAGLDYDLTNFNIGSDGLIDISKSKNGITLYTSKIIEKIDEKISGLKVASQSKNGVSSCLLQHVNGETGENDYSISLDGVSDFFAEIDKGFFEISLVSTGVNTVTGILRSEGEILFNNLTLKMFKKGSEYHFRMKSNKNITSDDYLTFKYYHDSASTSTYITITNNGRSAEAVEITEPRISRPLGGVPQ